MSMAEFDRQGKYLWHLVKVAGWDKPMSPAGNPAEGTASNAQKGLTRFERYLLKTFHVTHMNALKPDEMRRAIATMKPYADKAQFNQCKALRSQIMAAVCRCGYDKEWLHHNMMQWKYGDSLRELGFHELIAVRRLVRQALGLA